MVLLANIMITFITIMVILTKIKMFMIMTMNDGDEN